MIIAGIKSNSFKTAGGNFPSGKFAGLYQELYFLSLVNGKNKLLILTNNDLYTGFLNNSAGKVSKGIQIQFCQLPEDIILKIKFVHENASREQTRN